MRYTIALASIAAAVAIVPAGAGRVEPIRIGIDVLAPVEGAPWDGDRMRGARERLKDILPGNRT